MSGRSINRREFLRESAAAAALPLLGGVRPPSSSRATAEQLYRWASEHLRAGRCYPRAAELLELAVAARPDEPRYREALACAYFDRALEIRTWRTRQELGIDGLPPAPAPGTETMGAEALEAEARETLQKALAELQEAVRLAPESAEVHHTRGWMLAIGGSSFQITELRPEEARDAFETAVRLAPGEARYHRSLADVLWIQTPLHDGFPMREPSPGDSPPRPSPEVLRHLFPGPDPDQLARWSAARTRMLDAYRSAAALRSSDGYLHYTVFTLAAALQPGQPSHAWPHLAEARRLLPPNATSTYDLAWLRYRLAAESGSKLLLREQVEAAMAGLPPREREALGLRFGFVDGRPRSLDEIRRRFQLSPERIRQLEAHIPRLSARQALREAGQIETMSPVWVESEYPPLLATELRRLPLQDFVASGELHMRLRALAREAVADAEELRTAGDRHGAAGLLEEVLRLGERLVGDPGRVGPPENDGVIDKLVGLAIARIALKPLESVYQELGDETAAGRLRARTETLQAALDTAQNHIRRQHETRGSNWGEDVRAAREAIEARIRAAQESRAEPEGQA